MVCKDHYLPVPWLWSLFRRVRGTVGHHFLPGQISGLNKVGQGVISDVGSHPVASDGSLGRHGDDWWFYDKEKGVRVNYKPEFIIQTTMTTYEGD